MSWIDLAVMLGTLLFIVAYGTWKTRGSKNIEGYLRGDNKDRWWAIGLSVMATQASAITFLSTPGQAYLEGMGFVQFYFGLPIAMVVISVVFIPLYYKLKVFTAYEFLGTRFNVQTRVLTAGLFLIQRSLAAGITIYAPAIILSQMLGWSLNLTIVLIGVLVIFYTMSGGTNAVRETHKQQMAVIFLGMFIACGILIYKLTQSIPFSDGLAIAGKMGKMEAIDWKFDPSSKYNIWSGIIGGFFLQLSYFGTDQSQVQRYLSGASVTQSRLGLMFNGLLKIPMQFFILFVGVLVFLFYQFNASPIHFNQANLEAVKGTEQQVVLNDLEERHNGIFEKKKEIVGELNLTLKAEDAHRTSELEDQLNELVEQENEIRSEARNTIQAAAPGADTNDDDFIFITFVMDHLPVGIVGLLLAVIFSAAMSSTSAELNALASTGTVDIYKRLFNREASDKVYLRASRTATVLFGVFAIVFAALASLFENLIEAVNILGSLFYGTILGVFLVAFFFKWVQGRAVFLAAILAQFCIIVIYVLDRKDILEIGYLWYNMLAPAIVIVISVLIEPLIHKKTPT